MLWRVTTFLFLLILPVSQVVAITISSSQSARIDFTLPISAPFSLPAVILDFGYSFGPDFLNPGEGFKMASFNMNGTLLKEYEFTNIFGGNIKGCACGSGLLEIPLSTEKFYSILSSTSGTFDIKEVVGLAYDSANGYGNQSRAVGTITGIPEPTTLALMGLGLAGIGYRRHRSKKAA